MTWNKHNSLFPPITIIWIIGTCYGFVLFSSAAKDSDKNVLNIFVPGEKLIFTFNSSVLMNDNNENTKDIGLSIIGQVSIESIWGVSNNIILRMKLEAPKLEIISRKLTHSNRFVYHKSRLEEFHNEPFYIHWKMGNIARLMVGAREQIPLVNLKKSIASLIQFQMENKVETDVSGTCHVEYVKGKRLASKLKTNCVSSEFPNKRNPEIALGIVVNSTRTISYHFGNEPNDFPMKSIHSIEKHTISVASNEEYGFRIISLSNLEFVQQIKDKTTIVESDKSLDEVLDKLIQGNELREETLRIEKENPDVSTNFYSNVEELREQLKTDLFGSATSAKTFVKLVTKARDSSFIEMKKVVNSEKNSDILPQLLDIYGASPTLASYEAAMTKLDFTKGDLYERYLWALSLDANPNPKILEKLFNTFVESKIPEKLRETFILTIASMTYRLNRISIDKQSLVRKITEYLIEHVKNSKPEESSSYLRAMSNLRSPETRPVLLDIVRKGTPKEGVLAWKALEAIDSKKLSDVVFECARKTYLQLDRKHDSSSRTIALKMIMNSENFDCDHLREIIFFVASNDTSYEVKQFALQQIKMLAQDSLEFSRNLTKILKENPEVNNYSMMNPRGLSTAIRRIFTQNRSGRGSLVSLQEIQRSVVKRGVVNIVWEKDKALSELFSLGIFTSGLTNFVSNENEESDDENTLGGLELTILGTQLRPFVFFNSQGELMSHVWSGTASEKTPAFQALIMLQDHLEHLCLGSGFIAELDVKGAVSLDLSGQVAISLWGRSAESLVEKNAGIFLTGSMKIDTSFVRSQVEFNTQLEPQLKFESDLDFSSSVKFCSRLSQENVLLKHSVYKIERIPGSKHKLRIGKHKKLSNPGMTYSLNRKNNEMCNAIHRN